jgi:hypothetical protein
MDNQHKKIKGYRDLSQAEIDLMNRIKEKGAELLALHADVADHVAAQANAIKLSADSFALAREQMPVEKREHEKAFQAAEPHRWAAIAKTDIQTGLMALIRAVAQPAI